MLIKDSAALEKRNILKQIRYLKKQIRKLPKGTIRFHKNGKYSKWRYVTKDPAGNTVKDIYIPKSAASFAQQLCIKDYLLSQLHICTGKLAALDALIDLYANEPAYLDKCCSDHRKLLSSFLENRQDADQWASMPYRKNREYPEALSVETKAGVLVRSKSEARIADELFAHGIPFRYEQILQIGDMSLAPDFTIPDPSDMSKLILWEHFGRMDSPSYLRNNLFKLELYQKAGYVVGKNLIITFESENCPPDPVLINFYISYYLGGWIYRKDYVL